MFKTKSSRFILVVAMFALMWGFTIFAKNQIGIINFMIGGPGDITLFHQGGQHWQNAEIYMKILEEDSLKTKSESRCEIKLNDGSILRIGENTTFYFSRAALSSKERNFESELIQGRIWTNVKKAKGKKGVFQIAGPTAVCAIRGTVWRMEADSTTRIFVYQGAVDVGPVWWAKTRKEPQRPKSLKPYEVPGPYEIPPPFEVSLEQWVRIVKGFQIEVRRDGKYAKARINEKVDAKLPWVQWNRQRDQLFERD